MVLLPQKQDCLFLTQGFGTILIMTKSVGLFISQIFTSAVGRMTPDRNRYKNYLKGNSNFELETAICFIIVRK